MGRFLIQPPTTAWQKSSCDLPFRIKVRQVKSVIGRGRFGKAVLDRVVLFVDRNAGQMRICLEGLLMMWATAISDVREKTEELLAQPAAYPLRYLCQIQDLVNGEINEYNSPTGPHE